MLRYKVIVNPQADRGESIKSLPRVEELLKLNGFQYDLAITEKPWQAADLAQQAIADGYDVVIAAGGDGTANEVINGFMRARSNGKIKAAMGIIPIGRGNDFAYGMGAPTELEAAIEALKQDHRKTVDIAHVQGGLYPDGRYIGNGIGIGFDAVVGFVAARHKILTGFISYLWAALKTIFLYYKAPQVKIEMDDEEIVMDALMVSVMNGRRMGGGFMMAPDSEPDDGILNLCIANQVSQVKCLILLPKFMNATQFSDKDIRAGKARRVVVTALKGTLPVHGDGETIAHDADRIVMELFPKQIDLIVSPE
jgi:diacylglycerol kinase (ATP)